MALKFSSFRATGLKAIPRFKKFSANNKVTKLRIAQPKIPKIRL